MKLIGVTANLIRVKQRRTFTGRRHAEAFFTSGEPAEKSRAKKSLQVEDNIEPARVKTPDKGYQSPKSLRVIPPLTQNPIRVVSKGQST